MTFFLKKPFPSVYKMDIYTPSFTVLGNSAEVPWKLGTELFIC